MGKNEIVEELYRSREFNDCIGKMEPDHLRDDLKAEVMLILLETSEEKIRQLYEQKVLKFYTVRIILNLIQSKTSSFFKKYRQHFTPIEIKQNYSGNNYVDDMIKVVRAFESITVELQLTPQEEHKEREEREQIEDMAMNEINNLYWYNKEMVRLYLQHGNYRAIEEITRIPYSSAYKTIQKSFQEIKQKVLR